MAVLEVVCPRSQQSAVIRCDCPPEANGHACELADPDSAITCPPESGCCQEDHHHGLAGNGCGRGHAEPCGPGVEGCAVCHQVIVKVVVAGTAVLTGRPA